jgi:phosphotransferase system HPr (HPr) family protein
MSTISATVNVLDPIGLHARPAGQIVKLVKESGLEVRIGKAGEELVKANSPLRMMALKAKTGEELLVEIDTADQAVADSLIAQIQDFLKG